jgi:hypothetical protein
MFDANQQLKQELEQVTKERDKYKLDLQSERFWNKRAEQNTWSISQYEIDKINKDLGYRTGPYTEQVINPRYLKEIVMDVYHNPSKYTDIISKLMELYDSDSEHKREEKDESWDDDNGI